MTGDWPTRLLDALRISGATTTPEDLADALWLARWMSVGVVLGPTGEVAPVPVEEPSQPPIPAAVEPSPVIEPSPVPEPPTVPSAEKKREGLTMHLPRGKGDTQAGGRAVVAPSARALPDSLALLRALRPLMRRVPARHRWVIDEEQTARRVAEEGVWLPVVRPARERWLRLSLLVDAGSTMGVWRQTIRELVRLFSSSGAFLQVRVWSLDLDHDPPRIHPGLNSRADSGRDLGELFDAGGRSALLLVSDAVGRGWHHPRLAEVIDRLGRRLPLALVQMLPQNLWTRSALGNSEMVRLTASGAVQTTSRLSIEHTDGLLDLDESDGVPLSVLTLEPAALGAWARLTAGRPEAFLPGVLLPREGSPSPGDSSELSASERASRFLAVASPTARRLAGMLAASPLLSLPVLRLIRQELLPEARQVHEAEVLLGDILSVIEPATDPDEVIYDFHDGVRALLLDAVPTARTVAVLERVSEYVEKHLGMGIGFRAMLRDPSSSVGRFVADDSSFARIAAEVLERLGGAHAQLVSREREPVKSVSEEPAPIRWILLFGTQGGLSPLERLAAQAAARIVAEEGFGLVVANQTTFSHLVAAHFIKVCRQLGTEEPGRRLIQVLHVNETIGMKQGRFIRVPDAQPRRYRAVLEADAVVIIGGVDGPLDVGREALKFGKPVIPYASIGGASKRFHDEVLSVWESSPMREHLRREDFEALAEPMADDVPLRRALQLIVAPDKVAAVVPRDDRPDTWVLVMGWRIANAPPTIPDGAKLLGRMIAEEGMGLVTCGLSGIDSEVASAFVDAVRGMGTTDLSRVLRRVRIEGSPDRIEVGELLKVSDEWEQEALSLHLADIVVMFGERTGLLETARTAWRTGKSVLPLPTTAKAVRAVHFELVDSWPSRPCQRMTMDEFKALDDASPRAMTALQRLLRTCRKQSPARPPKIRKLPFVILVFADLAGEGVRSSKWMRVTAATFNEVFRSVYPRLTLHIPDAPPSTSSSPVWARFAELEHFSLESLCERIEELTALRIAAERGTQRNQDAFYYALRAVFQTTSLKRLEATWRGLYHLVSQIGDTDDVVVVVQDVSRQMLVQRVCEDRDRHAYVQQIMDRTFHSHLGKPIGLILADYGFSNDESDVRLLRGLSSLAASLQAPLVAGASRRVIGLDEPTRASSMSPNASALRDDDRFREFQSEASSRYVALTFPRLLARVPHPLLPSVSNDEPPPELVEPYHPNLCTWMKAGWVVASSIASVHLRTGYPLLLIGSSQHGLPSLESRATTSDGMDSPMKCCLEVPMTSATAAAVSEHRIIPVQHVSGGVYFEQMPMCHLPPDTHFNSLGRVVGLSYYVRGAMMAARDLISDGHDLPYCERIVNEWLAQQGGPRRSDSGLSPPFASGRIELTESQGVVSATIALQVRADRDEPPFSVVVRIPRRTS